MVSHPWKMRYSDQGYKSFDHWQRMKMLRRPIQPPIKPPIGMIWYPDWQMSDEFNRNIVSKWPRCTRWETNNTKWLGRPPGFFRDENVSVYNGSLFLHSREDTPPHSFPSIYHSFSTSFVRTRKARLYGYFEIICKLMESYISSTFCFTRNEADIWTELDVFQYSASNKTGVGGIPFRYLFNTNMHVHRHYEPDINPYNYPKSFNLNFDLCSKPIKVGLNWQKDFIEWYVNDSLVRKEQNLHFHQPLHLQLDSETFPRWFGLPGVEGNNNLPNSFEIFYVRSWYL